MTDLIKVLNIVLLTIIGYIIAEVIYHAAIFVVEKLNNKR